MLVSNTYDSMARPATMTGSASVSNVAYNPADQMTAMTHDGLVETRQSQHAEPVDADHDGRSDGCGYRYSATQNNGQITQMKNWISGEEVNYTYDALSRLSAASMSVAVDGNNCVVGHTYDAAGFTTAVSGTFTSLTWDGAGRLLSAAVSGGGTDRYQYDPSIARVWRNNRFFLRGTGGEVLAVYDFNPVTKTFAFVRRYAWSPGKMVGKKEDRLGTVQSGCRFYPYGEEWPATAQDDTKFATYRRDGSTNLDYAMNRYYQSTLGRFLSPDPFRGSASKARSGSCRVFGGDFVCEVEVVAYLPGPTSGGAGGGLYGHYAPQLMWDYSLEVQDAGLAIYFNQQRIEEGLKNARDALKELGGLGAKPVCRDFLDALSGAEQGEQLAGAVIAAAGATFDQNLLCDGPTSTEVLDQERFAESSSKGQKTVGEWFGFDARRQALSQQNGNAIWIRAEDWAGAFSVFRSGNGASACGLGTLMHEFFHKRHVGGFDHSQMEEALKRAGYSHVTLGRNQISDAIGRLCF